MKAYQSSNPVGSNSSFIGGTPYAASSVEVFADDFLDNLIGHIDDLINEATNELQEEAYHTTGWREYSTLLDVSIHKGTITYSHTGDASQDYAMSNLEYGTPSDPPTPLLRNFALQHAQDMSAELAKRIAQEAPVA